MQNKNLKSRLPREPVTIARAAKILRVSRPVMAGLLDGHRVLTVWVNGRRWVPVNELAGQLLR